MKLGPKLLFPFMFVILLPTFVLAQNGDEKEELPKSGLLSSSGEGGYNNKVVDSAWGENSDGSKESAPISGSISRSGPRDWVMRIINSSQEPYSVDLEAVQLDVRGKRIKSDFYSYSLKPQERTERKLSSLANTSEYQLKLNRWKNLGGAEKKKEIPNAIAVQPIQNPPTGK